MVQHRKNLMMMLGLVLLMIGGSIAVRQISGLYEWSQFFDIGSLLGVAALSFAWEREMTPPHLP